MLNFLLKLTDLSPIFLLKPRLLMILVEGFLVRPIIGITNQPSRRIVNGLGFSRKIGPNSVCDKQYGPMTRRTRLCTKVFYE